jgi:hypothetical protein
MGASHLNQESAFDLILGLCILDESQAGITAISEILPPGSLAASTSCVREAFTKALEAVPKAFFSSVPT